MSVAPISASEDAPPANGIGALFGQLRSDAVVFAKAEVALAKAKAGERAHYARPGLAMLLIGLALSSGVLVAVPVGALMWLAPKLGVGWALLLVISVSLLFAAALLWAGGRRLRAALRTPEER